jgi:hypothetical protein
VSLLQGLKQQLDDAIATGDMSAVQALSDQLGANDVNLAAAIAANTPQQPQPAPQGPAPGRYGAGRSHRWRVAGPLTSARSHNYLLGVLILHRGLA